MGSSCCLCRFSLWRILCFWGGEWRTLQAFHFSRLCRDLSLILLSTSPQLSIGGSLTEPPAGLSCLTELLGPFECLQNYRQKSPSLLNRRNLPWIPKPHLPCHRSKATACWVHLQAPYPWNRPQTYFRFWSHFLSSFCHRSPLSNGHSPGKHLLPHTDLDLVEIHLSLLHGGAPSPNAAGDIFPESVV